MEAGLDKTHVLGKIIFMHVRAEIVVLDNRGIRGGFLTYIYLNGLTESRDGSKAHDVAEIQSRL